MEHVVTALIFSGLAIGFYMVYLMISRLHDTDVEYPTDEELKDIDKYDF